MRWSQEENILLESLYKKNKNCLDEIFKNFKHRTPEAIKKKLRDMGIWETKFKWSDDKKERNKKKYIESLQWSADEILLLREKCSIVGMTNSKLVGFFPNRPKKNVIDKRKELGIKLIIDRENYKWSESSRKKHMKMWTKELRNEKRKQFIDDNPMKKEHVKKKFRGSRNPSKRKEFREFMSKNNPMFSDDVRKKHLKSVNTDEHKKCLSNHAKETWKKMTDEERKKFIEHRIDRYTEKLANGDIKIKSNRWKTGYYNRRNGTQEYYHSSYELEHMKELDNLEKEWTKNHGIRIPYVNEDGLKTFYIPDFLVDGNSLEEIKGWQSDKSIRKAKVAIEYCKKNNLKYKFYLGKDRKLVESLSLI
jgi:hypothetical protein